MTGVGHYIPPREPPDREFGRKRFGDEGYAMEGLVAEFGAAFPSADPGLTPEIREAHASYMPC
ncbi:zincin-like metallopeptidase domain-containing protein [Bradyrhizobium sp. PMVTL-01]|uniref:zincin-like metallopeptidase domain-containing protein n=1 Tax=Bradyrhizobium sp. PMVTL-01 TaxID=3434999 RepID=UPI003F7134F9